MYRLTQAKPEKDIDLVTFTNQERTEGVLSDGTEVDTVAFGRPSETDVGYRLSNGVYAVAKDPIRMQYCDGGSTTVFCIHASSNAVAANLYNYNTGSCCSIPIPADLVAMATTAKDNWDIGFTPSGKHIIFTIIENVVDSDLKTTTDLKAHWVYYKNYSISNNTLMYSATSSGEAVITGSLVDPTDPTINWDNTQILTSLTAVGSSTVVFENDPNFPENNEIAETIDWFPDSSNNYNSGTVSHNIKSVFYEELDQNGNLVPAVDFVGSIMKYKRKTLVKRPVSITGVSIDGHTMVATSSYTGSNASRAYYMDCDRLANTHVTLTSTYPYAAGVPGADLTNAIPGEISGQYSSGTISTLNTSLWGTGNQAYFDGPNCFNRHLHTALDTIDAGNSSSQTFRNQVGTSVESGIGFSAGLPLAQKVTFDYIQYAGSGSCITGTTTTTFGGIGQGQAEVSQSAYRQSTTQTASVFYYSANSGLGGVYSDPLSSNSGYTKETITSAFRSTSRVAGSIFTDYQAALINPSSSDPVGDALVVQEGYLEQSGTNVQDILFNGILAYTDASVLDLLDYPVLDPDFIFKVYDSSSSNPLMMISVEPFTENGIAKWRVKRYAFNGSSFTRRKLKAVINRWPSRDPDDLTMRG